MKKFLKILFKILGKLILAAVIFFAATFTLYMVNGENKLIYYVVRTIRRCATGASSDAFKQTHFCCPRQIFLLPGVFS